MNHSKKTKKDYILKYFESCDNSKYLSNICVMLMMNFLFRNK